MKVVPIASTLFDFNKAQQVTDYKLQPGDAATQMDLLPEFAGRMCYQSWNRPNPKTANNQGYIENILNQGHFSVLEHATVSFYVEGVSRALLTELERHRFLSFSVISQRYVRAGWDDKVVPPAIEEYADQPVLDDEAEGTLIDEFDQAWSLAVFHYKRIANTLEAQGLPKKKALEAARSVLPNSTEVKMVVTGNLRAWRDVLGKRYHEAADAEIRQFAKQVLVELRYLAPNSVQDIPEEPYQ